jgi:hypothetical protein
MEELDRDGVCQLWNEKLLWQFQNTVREKEAETKLSGYLIRLRRSCVEADISDSRYS